MGLALPVWHVRSDAFAQFERAYSTPPLAASTSPMVHCGFDYLFAILCFAHEERMCCI